MLIDCETCVAPAGACRDCVVTALLDRPPQAFDLDVTEARALSSLAGAGLVSPLRLVPVHHLPVRSDSPDVGRDIA